MYRIDIHRTPDYVVAGNVLEARDDRDYFEPSSLLPEIEINLKFDQP